MSGKRKSETTISEALEEKKPKDSGATSTKTMSTLLQPGQPIPHGTTVMYHRGKNYCISTASKLAQDLSYESFCKTKLELADKTNRIQALRDLRVKTRDEFLNEVSSAKIECVENKSEIQALKIENVEAKRKIKGLVKSNTKYRKLRNSRLFLLNGHTKDKYHTILYRNFIAKAKIQALRSLLRSAQAKSETEVVSAQNALEEIKVECVEKTSKIQTLEIEKIKLETEVTSAHKTLEVLRLFC